MSHLRPIDPTNPERTKPISEYTPEEQRHAGQQIIDANRSMFLAGVRLPSTDGLNLAEQLCRAGGDETGAGEAVALAKDIKIAERRAKP